ncbi:gluconate 2-dehydrogenase subunit 3 family protein [Granulicella arctica]|uniref:gluconate 2-dehydrogenase subunit 3 family protein n=1 Tax=Granulicella arctica TaxID=940613 RepID=UPI0021DF9C0D|nr:gluconate 2-dehydrogenase subunit 3 family protein [Granulicella arctica]
MDRREVLRLLASAAIIPALTPDAFSLFHNMHAELADTPGLKALNRHQDATVTMIAELIIPQTDTPGAKATKVNEFIDLILFDWYDDASTARFLAGLADVDSRSQKLFGKQFVDASTVQQTRIMQSLDDEASVARKQQAAAEAAGQQLAVAPLNFFGMMKKLTLLGYYTSEVGFENELHKSIIPASGGGCVAITGVA